MSTDTDNTPLLAGIIKRAVGNARRDMFGGWLPGRIHAFDGTRATVRLDVLDVEIDGADRATVEFPLIEDVPVVRLGSGTVRIKFPIRVGDACVVLFAARSIDRWLPAGARLDPGTDRDHDMSDACVITGLMDFGHTEEGDTMIEFTDSEILAGGTSKLITREEFLNHTHATAAVGPPVPPTEIVPTLPVAFPGTAKLRG